MALKSLKTILTHIFPGTGWLVPRSPRPTAFRGTNLRDEELLECREGPSHRRPQAFVPPPECPRDKPSRDKQTVISIGPRLQARLALQRGIDARVVPILGKFRSARRRSRVCGLSSARRDRGDRCRHGIRGTQGGLQPLVAPRPYGPISTTIAMAIPSKMPSAL